MLPKKGSPHQILLVLAVFVLAFGTVCSSTAPAQPSATRLNPTVRQPSTHGAAPKLGCNNIWSVSKKARRHEGSDG